MYVKDNNFLEKFDTNTKIKIIKFLLIFLFIFKYFSTSLRFYILSFWFISWNLSDEIYFDLVICYDLYVKPPHNGESFINIE